jgi:hypothetical protein
MDVGRRLKLGLLAVVATIGATMVFSTVAQARTIPDPMLSNVPYLAWRGEELRLVKCDPTLTPGDLLSPGDVDFLLVDWSGDPHLASPQLVPGTVAVGFRSFDGAGCVQGTFESSKAGLAMIKMVVTNPAGEKVLVHDFLAAWMNLNSIVACTKADPGPCLLGSPTSATDVAGGEPNVVEANVTGNIPLLQDFNELGIGHPITIPDGTTVNGVVLPDDWSTLANKLATVRGPLGNPVTFWDIHDDQLDTEGHAILDQETPAYCGFAVHGPIDAVDQCLPYPFADEAGFFSTIYQNAPGPPTVCVDYPDCLVGPAIGPFDPTRPGQTELSNGVVNAGDAPMPAARIDFTIAANTGGPTDISGVGSFTKVDKGFCEVGDPPDCVGGIYVRPPKQDHRLYAPFYRRYIPATRAPGDPFSSGTDDGFANNFNGYLNLTGNALADDSGLYDFWTIAENLRIAPGTFTSCLNFTNGEGVPIFRQQPEGPQSVVVYSDEHGEARVGFVPGTGFFFDNFGILNANLGCDLAGVATLGTAQITATAKYPFQPVTAQPITSNVVSKAVSSRFAKSIQCFPKGPSAFDQQVAICVASAQDITGAAIAGERVCFFADSNAEGIFLPALPAPDYLTIAGSPYVGDNGIFIIPAPNLNGTHSVCAFTDDRGRTAVEVVNSNPTTVNVSAFFVDEGLFRSVHVPFPITTPTVKVTGPVAAHNPVVVVTPSNPPPNTVGNDTTPSVHTDPNVQVRYRITFARLIRPLRGRPYLRIRLAGPAGKATFVIRYMSTKKQLGQVFKTVPANRTVRVRLAIPRRVRTMHLSVMPG